MLSLLGCRALIVSTLQLIVNHLVWSPLAGAAVLVMSMTRESKGPYIHLDCPAEVAASWRLFFLVVFVLILAMFIFACVFIWRDPRLKTNLVVALILAITWAIVGGMTAAIYQSQDTNLMRLWLVVLATVAVPAIPAFLTSKDTRKKYGWLIGVVSILTLFAAYLCLGARELILFLALESAAVFLLILLSSKEKTGRGFEEPEATG